MKRMSALIGALVLAMAAPVAAEPTDGAAPLVIAVPTAESRLDNFRLGVAQFPGGGIGRLFSGGGALGAGLDYRLDHGFALALDSFALFQGYETANYVLSLTPVQLKYRLGLPARTGAVAPFLSAGAGLSAMTLFGGEALPRFGVGLAGSTGIGAVIADTWTAEVGLNLGQVAEIGYAGWQIRLGTRFSGLGSGWAAPGVQAPLGPLAGQVAAVEGDRLVLALAAGAAASPGEEVLVYYEDGIVVKVAKARVEALEGSRRAIARVLVATETIKPGYHVRAW